jgi:hypothetical protein
VVRLIGWGDLVVWAIQAQFAVPEGGIDEGAMMRARRIVVLEGAEEAAGHTHAGDGDAAVFLKRADHRDQGADEGGLFSGR